MLILLIIIYVHQKKYHNNVTIGNYKFIIRTFLCKNAEKKFPYVRDCKNTGCVLPIHSVSVTFDRHVARGRRFNTAAREAPEKCIL